MSTPEKDGAEIREDEDTAAYFEGNGVDVAGFREGIDSGKPVCIYVYWPRGGMTLSQEETKNLPCRDTWNLENQCMSNPSAQAVLNKFVLIRLNAQDLDAAAFKGLNVKKVPALFFFNHKARLINKLENPKINIKAFIGLLDGVLAKYEKDKAKD